MIEHEKAISIIWAISQVVEIDDWAREDIAGLLDISPTEVEEWFEEAIDSFEDIEDTKVIFDQSLM